MSNMKTTKTLLRRIYNDEIINHIDYLKTLKGIEGLYDHNYLRTRVLESLTLNEYPAHWLPHLALLMFTECAVPNLTKRALSSFYTTDIVFNPDIYLPSKLLANQPNDFILCRIREAVAVGDTILAFRLALLYQAKL